jgi:diadenosine tetraphosphate (Ap4A) HIT family hydrolase
MPYDDNNVFAKILRGELPCRKIYESDQALVFHPLIANAPVHALVIPKGRYVSSADFNATASPEEITGFYHAVSHTAQLLGVEASGYRLISNAGPDSHQEVPHYHVHILGGRPLGPMLAAAG